MQKWMTGLCMSGLLLLSAQAFAAAPAEQPLVAEPEKTQQRRPWLP